MSLKDVHPEHAFRVKNGNTIKNLYELASELATIDEEAFKHHVNYERNDFHNWILHVVRDDSLARVFASIKDRRLMLAAVQRRINDLQRPQQLQHLHWHATLKDYVFGIIVGAVAMLMLTRLL
jgi:hypothetical protein